MRLNFRFRWVPFIAAVVAAAIGISLGNWQTRRAAEKEAIEVEMTSRAAMPALSASEATKPIEDINFRRVVLQGRFVPGWNVFLDNRPYNGVGGFHVLAPFMLEQGGTVLVKRGWAPRDPVDRLRVPEVAMPGGSLQIEGIVREHVGRTLQLGDPPPLEAGAIVQNAEIEQFTRAGKWDMLAFVVEQTSDTDDQLVRDWPRPSAGADKHRGYAFQWYGLAAAALIFYFVTGFSRGRN